MKEHKLDQNLLENEVQPLLAIDKVSCTINSEAVEDRKELLDTIIQRMLNHQIVDETHQLKFDYEEQTAHLLLDFILMEQQCCSFFDFDLKFRVDQNYLEFDISSKKVGQKRLNELVEMMIST